jgi:hypothetical protein
MPRGTSKQGDSPSRKTHPPAPPLVLHVGVIGHRPDTGKRPTPDVGAVRKLVAEILSQIRESFEGLATAEGSLFSLNRSEADATRVIRVISSLASGADQWVADEALRLGYELQAPIPFSLAEYEKDFQPQELTEFRRLKEKATAVLEMDGCRARAQESYEAAGRMVIGQSDLIIAIWDGSDEKGRGGTGQIVREALKNGVPVVWVRWTGPEQWKLLATPQWRLLEVGDELRGEFARLKNLVTDILLPPDVRAKEKHQGGKNERVRYSLESQRRWMIFGSVWRILRNIVLLRTTRLPWRHYPYVQETSREWSEEWDQLLGPERSQVDWIDKPYLTHYAWANQLALYYGGLHRSSAVLNYCLGALAVLCALLGIPALVHSHHDVATILFEIAFIGTIIFLTVRGAKGGWHERWIQYRILAERLRIARFLDLLGGGRQHYMMPGHLGTYGDPANTWIYWYYRAVSRSAGLPAVRFDSTYLTAAQVTWRDILIQRQIRYHRTNSHDLSVLDERLHRFSGALFGATFVACAIHLALELTMHEVPFWAGGTLVILNALLPAIGAAIAAIRNQGEFHRISQRSLAMREELDDLKLELSQIAARSEELRSQDMRRVCEQTARLMINETLDWRIVFQDRPLVLPA